MQKCIMLSFVLVILSGIALGQVPQLINYQALLLDPATGLPVLDGIYTIAFSIYDVASGGSATWIESQSVQTKDGLYSVLLGSITPLTPTILSGPEKYLGIKVGSDPEMTHRKRIVSVAYAITSSEISGDSNIFPSDGYVGIGTKSPRGMLELNNDSTCSYIYTKGIGDDYNYAGLILESSNNKRWSIVHKKDQPNCFNIIEFDGSDWHSSFTIKPGGDVGIGLWQPAYKLDVDGDINFRGSLYQNGSPFSGGSLWSQNGNDIYYNNGNVGIGDASPTHTLDVAGKIGINDTQVLYLPDQTDLAGTLYLGDGGGSLSHTGGFLTGWFNTALGMGALKSNTTGNGNTASGYGALYSNTTGIYNTASGFMALYDNTSADYNTASGYQALCSNTSGYRNTASGYQALYSNTTGRYNTASGYQALWHNTTGDYNTASGDGALYSNTTGYNNTASGYQALFSNTTGCYNTASGYQALDANTTGVSNTASGYKALYYNESGDLNTACGETALYGNTTGYQNTASGSGALSSNSTGNYNTACGAGALSLTTGSGNTACGAGALGRNESGTHNTAIGAVADVTGSGELENTTAIGYSAMVNASNKVVIGNGHVTVIGGYVNWSNLSDGRFKHSVQEDIKGLDFISKLRPVSYKLNIAALNTHIGIKNDPEYVSNSNKGDIVYSGFIGQEVEAAAREAGYDFSGVVPPQNEKDHYSLRYAEFVVPLVKAMQEQQKMIEDLRNEVAALKKRLGE